MQRIAVVATLRPGAVEQAERLIELGPPFDPSKYGVDRHEVFLAADTVVFVFEGGDPRGLMAALSGSDEHSVIKAWEPLLDGTPRVAREVYSWQNPMAATANGGWGE